jgi:hypothetical protein
VKPLVAEPFITVVRTGGPDSAKAQENIEVRRISRDQEANPETRRGIEGVQYPLSQRKEWR